MAGNGRGWTGLGRTADILGILAFFGISAVTFANLGDDEQPTVSAPTDTKTSRVEPTTTSEDSAPATTSPDVATSSGADGALPVRRVLLSELAVVDGSNAIDLEFTDVTIQGGVYENSLYYHCELFCNGDSPATYEVDLGGSYSSFTAFAGIVATGADAPTKIEVDVNGVLVQTYVVRVGQPADVRIPVSGAQRLRISIYAPAPLPSPMQAGVDIAGGVGHVFPDVALGKPTLLP